MSYVPKPIDTSHIQLGAVIEELIEQLAENTHDTWATMRMAQGWTYGEQYDDVAKTTPNLVPYNALPESEKDYDRATAREALKVVTALGFNIERDTSK